MRRFTRYLYPPKILDSTRLPITENYSTKVAAKVSAKYSNDGGNQKHIHILNETCIIPGCNGKSCIGLCGVREKTEVLGHNTHKPPVGRMAKRISDNDANGDPKPQWFVRNNTRKKFSEQERQHMSTKDIKHANAKQQAFLNTHTEQYA